MTKITNIIVNTSINNVKTTNSKFTATTKITTSATTINNKQQIYNSNKKKPNKNNTQQQATQHNVYFSIGVLCSISSKANAKSYSIFSRVNILTSGVHKQSTYFRVSIYSFGTHLLLTL